MLPDLRIVIVAVISTFLFTAGVGFYTSSRFIIEPRKSDSLVSLEDSPVNRIALNWPEPVQQARPMDLDFAVTLNGSRNPVRDVTNEITTTRAELNSSPAHEITTDSAATEPPETKVEPSPEEQAEKTSEHDQSDEPSEFAEHPVQPDAAPVAAAPEAPPVPARELAPPTAGLALTVKGVEAIVVPAVPAEEPAMTASIAPKPEISVDVVPPEAPKTEELATQPEQPAPKGEAELKSQPDPETTGTIALPTDDIPLPLAKPARASSKSKQAKKPGRKGKRIRARPVAPPAPKVGFPFNLFVLQPNPANPANPASPAAPVTSSAQAAARP